MNNYKEPINPLDKINIDIYRKLQEYPFSYDEIINVVLRTQNQINESLNPGYNKYYYFINPLKDGTNIGGCYEDGIRYRLNNMGVITFEEGDHNSGKDLDHPKYGTEIKTRKNLQFNNTNDQGRTHESTKYEDGKDEEDSYFILVQQILNTEVFPNTTHIKKIFFGRLSKRDFTNPNGTGAAYLTTNVRKSKCIEIWNDEIGNTIEHYQAWLDNDYYEKMIELENETKD